MYVESLRGFGQKKVSFLNLGLSFLSFSFAFGKLGGAVVSG